MLATLDNVQPAADVSANDSALNASRTDAVAAQAAVNTVSADLNSAEAEFEHAKLDYDRNKALYDSQLIAKVRLRHQESRLRHGHRAIGNGQGQAGAGQGPLDSAQGHISQNAANLRHAADVLSKTEYEAPFDGVITNVPVREGETVVPGIQNSPGSTLMTIADTSVITAEVKVDETDIVNVQVGQPAEVTIDAMPKQKFKGTVTEIGRNAVLRSTGVSTAQTDLQRAGSQGLQGGRGVAGSAAERASRTFGDRSHHNRETQQRAGDSDSGVDHPRARRT